ncbi:hypothetical protein VQ643_04195 [Pseudomonas sp. F1_0610]|uniref:hypothetical protein n=1 Tax=Pseudomonas sp. F1_0610 TaxID=3114284 RepID=UPI0039C1A45E
MSYLELLQKEVARSSMQKVANHLGVSRTTVSLLLSGKYGAKTCAMAQRIERAFGQINCPVMGQLLPVQCAEYHNRQPPLNNPVAMQHFRVCQSCIHNTQCKDKTHAKH